MSMTSQVNVMLPPPLHFLIYIYLRSHHGGHSLAIYMLLLIFQCEYAVMSDELNMLMFFFSRKKYADVEMLELIN